MSYCIAKTEQAYEEYVYKLYVTDALKNATRNTANFGGEAYVMNHRFKDVLEGNIDTRSADEIINDVVKKAGLHVVED